MKIFGRGLHQGQVSFAAHPKAGLTAARGSHRRGPHWLAVQKKKYRSPQVTSRGPKEDPAERLENSTGWRRDLCGGVGAGPGRVTPRALSPPARPVTSAQAPAGRGRGWGWED